MVIQDPGEIREREEAYTRLSPQEHQSRIGKRLEKDFSWGIVHASLTLWRDSELILQLTQCRLVSI